MMPDFRTAQIQNEIPPQQQQPVPENLRRSLTQLIGAAAASPLLLENLTLSPFAEEMKNHQHECQKAQSSDQLLTIFEAAIGSFASHGRKVEEYLRDAEHELISILSFLGGSLRGEEFTPEALAHIEELEAHFAQNKDLLALIQARKEEHGPTTSAGARSNIGSTAAQYSETVEIPEKLTHLPGLREAIRMMERYLGDHDAYVVVFKLTSLPVVEQRYGRDASRNSLSATRKHMTEALQHGDRLMQVGHNFLLACLQRQSGDERVRLELAQLIGAHRRQLIPVNGRTVMIANLITLELVRLAEIESVSGLLHALEPLLQVTN